MVRNPTGSTLHATPQRRRARRLSSKGLRLRGVDRLDRSRRFEAIRPQQDLPPRGVGICRSLANQTHQASAWTGSASGLWRPTTSSTAAPLAQ